MKLYLLRVGADSTVSGGGFHSPIFEGKSFMFIPIPEERKMVTEHRAVRYRDKKWRDKSIDPYLPPKLPRKFGAEKPPDQYVHNDPEFETFTYGSPQFIENKDKKQITEKNYNVLRRMQKGDILVFYAAFKNTCDSSMDGLYFFAYFIVREAVIYDGHENLDAEKVALVRNNHHYIHREQQKQHIVVVGDPNESKIFKKAVLLSSKNPDRFGRNYYPCYSIRELLDNYANSMNMSSLRTFEKPGMAKEFKQYLDMHSS